MRNRIQQALFLTSLFLFFALFLPENALFAQSDSSEADTAALPVVEGDEVTIVERRFEGDTLQVATKVAPPFSMKKSNGEWHGISIELWRSVAEEMGVAFVLIEEDLQGMLDGVKEGRYDVGIAAISITVEREQVLDFSQAYYQSGLGIAVSAKGGSGAIGLVLRLFSTDFLSAIAALLVLLGVVGIVIWLVERKKNPEQFGGSPWHGIGSGFWWSAVTMTTVGYGDKAPVTVLGRLIGLIWMFAAIIIISSFTAAIAASLTVSELGSDVEGPNDLPNVRVGAIEDATADAWLGDRSISHRNYKTLEKGMDALADGEIDAFVHDAPMLKYAALDGYDGDLGVLPETFDNQFYGVAMPENSPLREEINRSLLLNAHGPSWNRLLLTYIGE